LEELETRAVPAAVRPGFDSTNFPGNDDGSVGPVSLGFSDPINFFGPTYSDLFVNNNGNVTFGSDDFTYTPFGLTSPGQLPRLAPFFADVDTRIGQTTHYGTGTVDGHAAFGVTWPAPGVGYYLEHTDLLNIFQLVIVERFDTGPGNFDIEFNYDQIQWETGDASGGSGGFGGASAHAGFTNGSGDAGTNFEIAGSGVNGALLDGNAATGLIHNRLNSDVDGRYVFFARAGTVIVNEPPTAEANGAYSVNEGGSVVLSSAGSTDPDGSIVSYEWDFDYDGVTFDVDATGPSPTFSAADLDGPSSRTVALRVTDDAGASDIDEATVDINNVDPEIASLSLSSDSIDEGSSTTLTIDWSDPGTPDTFTVDINWGDGTIESFSAPASASGSSSQSYTHIYRDDGGASFVDSGGPLGWLNLTPGNGTASDVYGISVTVTDDDGGSDSASTSVTVNNVAPTVSEISGVPLTDDPDQCNTTWLVSGQFNDPGTDTYRFEINWGDGAIDIFNVPGFMGFPAPDPTDIPAQGPYGPFGLVAASFPGSASHTYGAFGTYVITVTVLDDDGGSTSATVGAVAVEATAKVITDSLGDTILDIHGTDFNDDITVNKSNDPVLGAVYKVHANSWTEPRIFAAAGIDRIRITLCDGDDHATVSGGISIPAIIYGDAGADRINGGGGLNVILGGAGNDTLTGGSRRDVLVGGAGQDRIVGNNGDDVLIGGATDYDADYNALVGLLADLSTLTTSTVHDDGAIDELTGSAGIDKFFAQLDGPFKDTITDKAEILVDLI
jgi:hypothetical protein